MRPAWGRRRSGGEEGRQQKGVVACVQVLALPSLFTRCTGSSRELGDLPSVEALRGLGLREVVEEATRQHASGSVAPNPFASIIPFLSGLPGTSTSQDKDAKPARFLVVKGLPTLPTKLVEKAWNMEFVEMEDFLPAPRSLRPAEQGKPSLTLQESLVGALSK